MVSHTGKKNTGTNSRSDKRSVKKRGGRFQTRQIQHTFPLSFVLVCPIIQKGTTYCKVSFP